MALSSSSLFVACLASMCAGVVGTRKLFCPSVAMSLVLDDSGSIGWEAHADDCDPIAGGNQPCSGAPAMKVFSKRVLDAVHQGPRGLDNKYNVVKFTSSATTIQQPTANFHDVRHAIDNNLYASGGTRIDHGINQAKAILDQETDQNLVKVMVVVTDGESGGDYQAAAAAAKAAGITIFAFGFANGHMNNLAQIAGAGAGSAAQCTTCHMNIGSATLDALNAWINDNLCSEVNHIGQVVQPWQACSAGDPMSGFRTRDNAWTDCAWSGCNQYPQQWILDGAQNGSSSRCVQLAKEGRCDDEFDPTRTVCGCTCRHCCKDPTPSPTSAPTVSPTSNPTSAPTHTPTLSPTAPTETPTMNPTGGPTLSPTAPTEAPTHFPTFSPTDSPTVSPTWSPTADPTLSPTQAPTEWPTYEGCPQPDVLLEINSEGAWFETREALEKILENYCHIVDGNWTKYVFDDLWSLAIQEERIKVIRGNESYNLFDISGNGIDKQPFEPLKMGICWPDDFPRTQEEVDLSALCGEQPVPKSLAVATGRLAFWVMAAVSMVMMGK